MEKDTKTNEKTRHSSLCREMSFRVPTGWKELSQEDLRYMLRLLWIYDGAKDWEQRVQVAALLHFAGIEVYKRTDRGWLCRESKTCKSFLLEGGVLLSMLHSVEWTTRLDYINVRLDAVGSHKAVDFELQELKFGMYLEAEGLYQSYLQTREVNLLVELGKRLYGVEEDEEPELQEEVLLGVLLWFSAAKQLLGREFPNFLKPVTGEQETITRESLIEGIRAQIRLLTKGDVTKEEYIRNNVDTWTALAELDALSREAEEIQKKYGK
ncbi:MAG: hypothetical protein ACTTKJ_06645 [Prevotella koreensis]|uniref:hypothetical protein n=1 Tax=Prevotella koreensis TaxID=2490854 RepID=UPI003F9EC8B0